MLRLRRPAPAIRFTCRTEDAGVIAPPVPAKAWLPDWFRRLPPVDSAQVSATDSGLTVKRCMPFLDAMTTGWVIPLAATVRLEVSEGGGQVDAGWDHARPMVSFHGGHQVRGNPMGDRAVLKFHNWWTIRTPPGWSCLFTDPLNRPNGLFTLAAGVVDTDTYQAEIHFPGWFTGPDGVHVIEKGTPLVQVIPFRRDAIAGEVAVETSAEAEARARIHRATQAGAGWYRNEARADR